MLRKIGYYFLLIGIMAFASCVPKKKFTELTGKKQAADIEIAALKSANEKLEAEKKECDTQLVTANKDIQKLVGDTAKLGRKSREMSDQVENLVVLNDTLTQKMNTIISASDKKNKILLEELRKKEVVLNEKETVIVERETQLKQLQDMLAAKDSASNALKNKLTDALSAFRNKGLTVTEQDGKVYVSMEAKLLFASGSTAVDASGKKALQEIAAALADEGNVEIVVEGHTDTDKLNSSMIPRDNWELSVLRATEVVKILSEQSQVKPQILSAAGRGEFHPVDVNDKAKNRRIEIIIQPSMKEIYQWIEKH
jgi:chemotaxis protein MotB